MKPSLIKLITLILIFAKVSPTIATDNKIDTRQLPFQIPSQIETALRLSSKTKKAPSHQEIKLININPQLFKKIEINPGNTQRIFGGGDAGGGNTLAIRFIANASQGIYSMDESQLPQGANKQQLLKVLNDAKILVTQDELFIEDNETGIIQPVEALNFPSLNLIVLNESRLNSLTNARQIQSLGVHEVLSLMGFESSGRYQYSSLNNGFQFNDFSLNKIPPGTKFSFTQAISFNVNTPFRIFEPESGYNFVIENPTDGRKQIIIQPRTCLVKEIQDHNYFKKYGKHPSVNRVVTFDGDTVCQKIRIVFWPAANNDGKSNVWYPDWNGSPVQSFQVQSVELTTSLGIEVIIPAPDEI